MARRIKAGAYDPFASRPSLAARWAQAVLRMPRLTRVGLVSVFALSVTVAIFPLVDSVYVQFFFSQATVILPSLVSAGFGLLMYILGWWLLVGTVGEAPPARISVLWYVAVGLLAIVLIIVLALFGIVTGNAPLEP